jgi:hypothetical protein
MDARTSAPPSHILRRGGSSSATAGISAAPTALGNDRESGAMEAPPCWDKTSQETCDDHMPSRRRTEDLSWSIGQFGHKGCVLWEMSCRVAWSIFTSVSWHLSVAIFRCFCCPEHSAEVSLDALVNIFHVLLRQAPENISLRSPCLEDDKCHTEQQWFNSNNNNGSYAVA